MFEMVDDIANISIVIEYDVIYWLAIGIVIFDIDSFFKFKVKIMYILFILFIYSSLRNTFIKSCLQKSNNERKCL